MTHDPPCRGPGAPLRASPGRERRTSTMRIENIQVDRAQVPYTELPGIQPTLGYLSIKEYPIERVAQLLVQKLRGL